jgi:hypothetical protein
MSESAQCMVGVGHKNGADLPPSQQMATSHLPSASSRAAVIDAPATPRTYSLRPGKGTQSYISVWVSRNRSAIEWRVHLQGQTRCGSRGQCLGDRQAGRQHSIDRGMLSGRSRMPGRAEARRQHRKPRSEEIGEGQRR